MSLTTALQALDAQRDALANNLTTKGVPSATSETLSQLVPKVLDIPAGGSDPLPTWSPKAQWQDLSDTPANSISLLTKDNGLDNAFTVTTAGAGVYKVKVTGGVGDVTINGVAYAQGVDVEIASGVQCYVHVQEGLGKATDYGYTTYRIDITSTDTIVGFMTNYTFVNAWYEPFSRGCGVIWAVINAALTSTAEMFADSYDGRSKAYSLECVDFLSAITTIGDYCLSECRSVERVTIPSTVSSIGLKAFYRCYSLYDVTLPSALTTLSDSCFYQCYSLRKVDIPAGVTTIPNGCFYYCYGILELTLHEGLQSISTYAFSYNHSLRKLVLPSTVTSLSTYCFSSCFALIEVTFNAASMTSMDSVFDNCYSLRKVTNIPGGYTSLLDMFSECQCLEEASLPEGITTIGSYTMNNCNFEEINIPSTVTSLSMNGLSGNKRCRKITIPSGVTVSYFQMNDCYSLLDIVNLSSAVSAANISCAFYRNASFKHLNIPNIGLSGLNTTHSTSLEDITFKTAGSFTGTTTVTCNLDQCGFQREGLVHIFNQLPTVSGTKTIKVLKNPGTANLTAEDKAIATAKGWIVTVA